MPGCKAKIMGRTENFLNVNGTIILLIIAIIICVNILPLRFPKWGVTSL